MVTVYVDADGCPVKREVYRVADRYQLAVVVVSNSYIRTPADARYRFQAVGDALDAADDWIAENIEEGDIVITADIPLADRCIKRGARVLGFKGREFTDDSIGEALASRELSDELRQMGLAPPGSTPFEKKDRSRFLQQLDQIINELKRRGPASGSCP